MSEAVSSGSSPPQRASGDLLAGWVRAAQLVLKRDWQQHIAPVLLYFVLSFMMVGGLFFSFFVLATVAGALEEDWIVFVALGVMVLGSMGMGLALTTAASAYMNAVLHSLDTGKVELARLRLPLGLVAQLLLLHGLTMIAVLTGFVFCMLPGLAIAGLLALAPGFLLVARQGVGDAILRSVDAAKRHPVDVFGMYLLLYIAMVTAASIPGIGGFLAMAFTPVSTVITAVAVRTLAAESGLDFPLEEDL